MTAANSSSHKLHHVHLILAREADHPTGNASEGYDMLLPLDTEGHLDAAAWAAHEGECRIRKFRANAPDIIGHLRHEASGQWYIDYGYRHGHDDIGSHFGERRFARGEYLSLLRDAHTHTYQIVEVEQS